MLVTGDLGFGVLKPFWETYPEQFVNAGIAEQSMTGLAAGLAKTGRTVLTYSIGNFPTLRCLEQIRNDCAYHNLNVKVVCVGGGFVYGSLGMSHHATGGHGDYARPAGGDGVYARRPGGGGSHRPGDAENARNVLSASGARRRADIARAAGDGLADAESADTANGHGHRNSIRRRHPDADGECGKKLAERGISAEVVSFRA